MDEKTSLLICLGASAAANCIPCFQHYHKKSSAAGISSQEVLEALELAYRVKNGAHMVLRNGIRGIMGDESPASTCGCGPSKSSCCD